MKVLTRKVLSEALLKHKTALAAAEALGVSYDTFHFFCLRRGVAIPK